MMLQKLDRSGPNNKSPAHRLLHLVAAIALVVQLLAATSSSGQQVNSARQNLVGGTKQATKINSNGQTAASLSGDQSAAPFYSIKDGKTSARRIQQQQSMSSNPNEPISSFDGANSNQQQAAAERGNWIPSTTVSTLSTGTSQSNNGNNRDELPVNQAQSGSSNENAFNEDNVKRLVNDRQSMQQQQQVALSAGSSLADQQSTVATVGDQSDGNANENNNISQQQMLISSFNQLVGADGALDDFPASATSTAQPNAASNKLEGGQVDMQVGFEQQQQRANPGSIVTTTTSMPSMFDSTTFKPMANEVATGSKQGSKTANRLVLQPLSQQQPATQFTTATGAPLSTPPSSLSMSLDGMIVNSRPRSPSSAGTGESSEWTGPNASLGNRRQQLGSSKATLGPITQSPARMGELASTGNNNLQLQNSFNGATKASRRVPFTGVPFSSPATKGPRTKPNKQVSSIFNGGQQASAAMGNGIFGPQANDLMNGLQQFDSAMAMMAADKRPGNQDSSLNLNEAFKQNAPNSGRPLMEQLNSGNFVQQDQQMDSNLLQGFDEELQQRPQRVNMMPAQQLGAPTGEASIDSNTLELMKNLINSPSIRGQMESGSNFRSSNSTSPDDMVMSVMSSVDGKERRLVMIARNTLEGLQRFAAQNQQRAGTGNAATKSQGFGNQQQQSNRRPTQQQQQLGFATGQADSSLVTGPSNNWWPSGGQVGTWAPSMSNQQNFVLTTVSPFRESSQNGEQQQQQEVQLQTTTMSPINLFGSTAAITTTSPQINTGSTISATQSPDFGQSKLDLQTDSPRARDDMQFSTVNATSASSAQVDAGGDSFREVPVSSLTENSADSATGRIHQQTKPLTLGGNARQQNSGSQNNAKSKTNTKSTGSSSLRSSGGKQSETGPTEMRASNQKSTSKKQVSGGGGIGQQRGKQNNSASGIKSGANGKRKNNGNSSSGRQTNGTLNNTKQSQKSGKPSGSKLTQSAGGSSKKGSSSGGQSGQSSRQQSGNQQLTGSIKVTNGQQQPAAMRALERQSVGADTTGKRPLGGLSADEQSMVSQSSAGFGSNKSDNEQANAEQQQRLTTTTTSSSVSSNKRPAQKMPNQVRVGGEDKIPDRQWASQAPVTQLPSAGTRLSASGEFGRGGSSASSWMDSSDSQSELGRFNPKSPQNEAERLDSLRAAIPGEPQVDYPIYSAPPKTSFDCMSQSCPGGYYADLETQCQVFHICQNDGRFDTFLCPNGTIFSQQHFVCVWWWQVDCQQSASFYKLNDGIYCNSMFSTSAGGVSLNANSADTVARSNGTAVQMADGTNRFSLDGLANDFDTNQDATMGGISLPSTSSMQTSAAQSMPDSATSGPSSTSSSSFSSSSSLGSQDESATLNNKAQSGSSLSTAGMSAEGGKMKQQAGETQSDDADLSQQHIERLVKKA